MVARINTVTFEGVDVQPVDVQVQIAKGMPSFSIVGLPDKAVAESKERVRSALHALGISMPSKRVTINLAPADIAKEGSHYDLPIALGLLAAMDILPADTLANFVVMGELSLDAALRPVAGTLPAAMHAVANDKGMICPKQSGNEARWAGELDILAPDNLIQIVNHMKGAQLLPQPDALPDFLPDAASDQDNEAATTALQQDLSALKGQETAKRALEIAAAGGHNILLSGPPGAGKSMLAGCLPGILPPLTSREALETSMVHSVAGTLPAGGLVRQRPFRDPHHSASLPALVGGGHKANPGDISLAHNGVLFLDELPEFSRATLESLRQPLETGKAVISRANHHVTYPARFQLIAAMNPCKCGFLGDAKKQCVKAPACARDYQMKLSGPLLDRIDLFVDMPAVEIRDLSGDTPSGETSAVVARRVLTARQDQYERQGTLNAHIPAAEIDHHIRLADDARAFLLRSAEKLGISARGYHRLLRVARTIADLNHGETTVTQADIAECLGYRSSLSG